MSENNYKEIADKIKKEKGFVNLIDSANEEEKSLFDCCKGGIERYKELLNKALDEWENNKEEWEEYRDCVEYQYVTSFLLRIYPEPPQH